MPLVASYKDQKTTTDHWIVNERKGVPISEKQNTPPPQPFSIKFRQIRKSIIEKWVGHIHPTPRGATPSHFSY